MSMRVQYILILVSALVAFAAALMPAALPSAAGEPSANPAATGGTGEILVKEEYLFDFETDADFDDQPDRWVRIIDSSHLPWVNGSLVKRQPYGKAYLIILNHAPAALETRKFLKIDYRSTYALTGEVSTHKMGETTISFEVRFFNKLREPIPASEIPTVSTGPIGGTGNSFITFEKTFGPLPEEAVYTKIRCVLDGREEDYGGKCVFDNIRLKPFPAISLVPERRVFRRGQSASLELRFAGLRPGIYNGEKAVLDWQSKPLARPQKMPPMVAAEDETIEPDVVTLPTESVGFYYFRFILRRKGEIVFNMLEPFLVVEDPEPMRTMHFGVFLPDEPPSTGEMLKALDNLGVGVVALPFDLYHLDNAENRRERLQQLGKRGFERAGFFRLRDADRKVKEHRGCEGILDCLYRHESAMTFAEKNFRAFGDSIEDWILSHPMDPSVLQRGLAPAAKEEPKFLEIIGRMRKASSWPSLGVPFSSKASARLNADITLTTERFGALPAALETIETPAETGSGNDGSTQVSKLRRWAVIQLPQKGETITRDDMVNFSRQLIMLRAAGVDTILIDPLWGEGLFDAKWKMRPLVAIYRTMVRTLGDYEPSPLRDPITGKELHFGPDVKSLYFRLGEEYLLAVWTDKPGGTMIRGFWGKTLQWSDIWGETRGRWGLQQITGAEGKFREDTESRFVPGIRNLAEFHVVREPRFITGIDVPLIKTQLSLQFVPDRVLPRSQPQKLSLRLTNFFSREIQGKVRIQHSTATEGWEFSTREFDYSLDPGATWIGDFEVSVPSAALSGKRPVSISVTTSSTEAVGQHQINVERELEISRLVQVAYSFDRNANTVRFTLTNNTTSQLDLYAYTGLSGHRTQEDSISRLLPGKSTKYNYRLPEKIGWRGRIVRLHLVEKRGDLFQNDELLIR